MAKITELGYERKPPIGNTLIDDEAGTVLIRIFPDRTLGRISSRIFAAFGCCVLAFVASQISLTGVGILRVAPPIFLAMLFFLLALIMRYDPRRGLTTIVANSNGVEYAIEGFTPRHVQRSQIRQVLTRDVAFSKRMSLCLRMVDGADMILGTGECKEIDAMARALHRVLNSTDESTESDEVPHSN